jgi:RNA polymerase sigma-70 factor (sigma-E family)
MAYNRMGGRVRLRDMTSEHDQAYVEFVTAQLAPLSRLALLLCGDPHRADDLVQQAITKLYLRWHRVDEIEHLDRYVRTILVREFLDERRIGWARVRLFAEPVDVAVAAGDDADDRMVVRAALAKVPRRQRAVLILRFIYDLSVEETATELGCTNGTVKSQTSHGLAALRRHLAQDGWSFDPLAGGGSGRLKAASQLRSA